MQGGTAGSTTGVYYPASNQVAIATNGVQALLVDANQNTTLPAGKNLYFTYGSGYSPRLSNSASNDSLSIFTSNVEAVRVNASGNLAFQVSNAGIVFNNSSALTNSTLNDYETGTVANPLVIGGTQVSSSSTYTKIGNMVAYYIYIDYTAGSTGAIKINLPFVSNSNYLWVCDIYSNQYGYTQQVLNLPSGSAVMDVSYDINPNNTFSLNAANRFYIRSVITYKANF